MEKIIIYTCITGGYDSLQQPFLPAEGFEFICFVERGAKREERVGAWRIEEIPYGWNDDALLARSQKLNPHAILPEDSGWSLWIDANIRIVDDSIYRLCRELQAGNVPYAGIAHPSCDCAYEEAVRCMKEGRDGIWRLVGAVTFLRRAGVAEHSGLQDTSLIFRKHGDPAVMELDLWWWECLVHVSNRDQLTQVFALQDTPALSVSPLFPQGVSVATFSGLEKVVHKPVLSPAQRLVRAIAAFKLRAYVVISRYIIPKAARISFE